MLYLFEWYSAQEKENLKYKMEKKSNNIYVVDGIYSLLLIEYNVVKIVFSHLGDL